MADGYGRRRRDRSRAFILELFDGVADRDFIEQFADWMTEPRARRWKGISAHAEAERRGWQVAK